MPRPVALHQALDLAREPTLAGIIRRQPLPDGVIDVIKVAAGSAEATAAAVERTRKTPAILREAAIVYLQTALFTPYGDSYRILGVPRTASPDEMRRHLGWLMKWLHPDRQRDEWQSSLAERVLSAWDDLKTAERRAGYDRMHPPTPVPGASRSRRLWRRPWLPWVRWPGTVKRKTSVRRLRLAAGIAIGAAALTILLAAGHWYGRRAAEADTRSEVVGMTGRLEGIVEASSAAER